MGNTAALDGYGKSHLLRYSTYGGDKNADVVLVEKAKVKKPLTRPWIIVKSILLSTLSFNILLCYSLKMWISILASQKATGKIKILRSFSFTLIDSNLEEIFPCRV